MIDSLMYVALTLIAYCVGLFVFRICKQHPIAHPLLIGGAFVIVFLNVFNLQFSAYQTHSQLVYYLLSAATVALAVPLYNQLQNLRKYSWRVLLPICVGGVLAPLFAWITVYLLDTPLNIQMTMLVKSITTPLALEAAELIGGIASLSAVLVILTGVVTAVFGPFVFALLRISDDVVKGVSYGTVGHAVGTSKAISISEVCGAFSSLALCLNGLVTALLLPLLFS